VEGFKTRKEHSADEGGLTKVCHLPQSIKLREKTAQNAAKVYV